MLNLSTTDILTVILMIAVIGLTVLLLVANELGKRSGLHFSGRLALVGGLGLGVIAFTIKAGLALYLNSLSAADIAVLQNWQKAVPAAVEPEVAVEEYKEPDPNFWTLQALPETAPIPEDNQPTPEKLALGKQLFFDTRLSADETLSCASCHKLPEGGDDNASFSTGIRGQHGNRNAPTVWNAAFLSRLFWDGRADSLEAQAKGPLVNPVEMGMASLQAVERKVAAIPEYQTAFRKVFGQSEAINIDNIAKAIGAYERTLITPDAPYDRFVRGDDKAMTRQQIRGLALFMEIGCRNCHMDPTFSSAGLVKPFGTYRPFPIHEDSPLVSKYDLLIDGKRSSYRVPSLRNVALTAPYFHNGSVTTLEEAIRVMATAQLGKKLSGHSKDDVVITWPDGQHHRRLTMTRNRALSDDEIEDIAAFLRSLSGNVTSTQKASSE